MLPLLNGAELNNSIMSVSTKGNEFCELKYRNGKIIDGASFALTVDGKTSNLDKYPGNSVRSALGDYPFIKFSGSMPQADFKGKISFPGNSEMSYELNAELKDKLTGQAFFYAWLPSANLNGCKYEYLKNDRWESGFLGGKNNPRVSLNGWSVLKLYTRDKLVIEITSEAGYACLVRWDSAKKEKQAFRLTIFPNNKTTGKKSHLPQNFKIAYSVKVTPDTGNGIDSDREVADCAVIGNKTAVKSGTLLLVPVSELTGKIKFNGLSGFKVSCNGKELRSQLEDRNLNNKVDKYDLLVIEPEAQDSVKWQSMRITGIYKQSAPVFSKLSGRKYTEDNIYFEELSTTSYSVGVAGSGKLALKIPSRYIDAPVNPDALNIPDGIFMTKGKLRIRIDSVFRHNDIPITRSFAYNLKDKTVTYSTAIWTLNGWTKHFVEISPSGKNYLPAIAYMYGDICFGNNPAFFYGDYGDVLSGLYKPTDFSGFSCGILAEQLKGNAWSPRAGVRGDLFSLFYTPIASSFYGKIQLAFNGGKKDFNAAVDRCKSKYDLDFYHDAAKLNRKLDSDKQALAGVSAQCKQVEQALDALKQAGLYTASLEIDLGTVKSWARAAEIDLNKCHLQRLSQRVAKINATLEKIRLNIKTVEDRQIKLQVPEGETKFYFGVVEGTRNILERDFKERYVNPARYAPLQIAGIKNVQYHSFNWNDKIDTALGWINMLRGIGMNGYAQLGMEHSPGFIDKYPEYIKFCDNFKQTNELRPFSPLFHKYFKGCEKLTAEIKTLFRSYGRRLATETETDLIFGINEPTPLHMLYEGAYKTTFIYGMRNYLKARYKNIAALNQAWNSSFKSFEDVQWDNAFLTEKFTHQGQQYLDGIWEFKEDPRNEGISKKWFVAPPAQLRKINVPGYWERQIPALKDYNGIAWYFKHINLKAGKYRLTFKAIDDNAVVYLNGRKIASNNGFNKEFSVDINEGGLLAVRVEDTNINGGISRSVTLTGANNGKNQFPYYSEFRYPARCMDYYDYRNRVVADMVALQVEAVAEGAPSKSMCIKEWTGSLNYMSLTLKCDPFYMAPVSRGYVGWDIYSTDDEYTAYQATLRQSTGGNRPSIIGEFGLIGSGNSFNLGTGAIQNAPARTYRLLGRNVRGIFYFYYGNLGACALVDDDFSVPERLIKAGVAVRTLDTLHGVFDSTMPQAQVGIYFSRNDGLISINDVLYNQLRGLFHLFYKNSINVEFVDSGTLQQRAKQLNVVLVPSSPFISVAEWEKLMEYRRNGGTLLVNANTGLMNLNNTRRTEPLCPGVSFNGLRPDLKLGGSNVGLNQCFGMKLDGKVILAADDKTPLLTKYGERLYLSNLDLGNAYREGNNSSSSAILATVKDILKQASVKVIFSSVISDREVQILENKQQDTFIFISSGNSEVKDYKIRFDARVISAAKCDGVIYDYLNLAQAELTTDDKTGEMTLLVKSLKPDEQGVWLIGKSTIPAE